MTPIALALLLFAVPGLALAQSPHASALEAIRSLAMAGTDPIVAESTRAAPKPATVVAIVQLTTETAALVVAGEVRPGTYDVVARSRPFSLAREANFGAWIEQFRYTPPDRIELSLTARAGCARSLTTHRFVLRNGSWLVAGLDTSAPRCTDNGVEQDWAETTNYLTGKTVRTTFAPSQPPREVRRTSTRRPFPLAAFPPAGPEAAYAELQ